MSPVTAPPICSPYLTVVGPDWFWEASVRLLGDARRGAALPDATGITGLLLLGWGICNLMEGIVDHHLLELHHVRDLPAHVPLYNWLFLGLGSVGLVLLGRRLSRPRTAPTGSLARRGASG